jgi:hypothetical protein
VDSDKRTGHVKKITAPLSDCSLRLWKWISDGEDDQIEHALRQASAIAPNVIGRILTFTHFWTCNALQASRSS